MTAISSWRGELSHLMNYAQVRERIEQEERDRLSPLATKAADSRFVDPEQWLAQNAPREGSWWPAWQSWLAARSGPAVAPPPLGSAEKGYPTCADAPGTYVLMP